MSSPAWAGSRSGGADHRKKIDREEKGARSGYKQRRWDGGTSGLPEGPQVTPRCLGQVTPGHLGLQVPAGQVPPGLPGPQVAPGYLAQVAPRYPAAQVPLGYLPAQYLQATCRHGHPPVAWLR